MKQSHEGRRLLAVRLGAMGDVIHALPAVALLKRTEPELSVSWAIEPRWAPLLEGNPDVDQVVELPLKNWTRRWWSPRTWSEARRAIGRLREREFDVVVDFQGLMKSAAAARAAGGRIVAGFEARLLREPLAANFYTRRFAANRTHVVDRNLALARAISGERVESKPEFRLPAGERSPDLPDEPFILAAPLAGWRAKEWPPERYAELATLSKRERGMSLVLDGAPRDAEALRAIAAGAPSGACRIHLSDLPRLIGAARAARAVVGVDSGPCHLAAALGTPGVAVFGPTDPARNGPYGDSIRVIRRAGVETTYKRSNRYSDSMRSVTAAEVWRLLCETLQEAPPLRIVASSTLEANS